MIQQTIFTSLIISTILICNTCHGFVIVPTAASGVQNDAKILLNQNVLHNSETPQTKNYCIESPIIIIVDEKDAVQSKKSSATFSYKSATAGATIAVSIMVSSILNPFVAMATSVDIDRGSTLFEANCAGCHRGGVNYISESKTLQKDALEKYLSLDQPKVQEFVQNKMPHKFLPFHQDFTDKDYLDVTSFVLDQATGQKW